MRLLLVEDDDHLREALERGLAEEGYVVDSASTVTDAISYLRAYEYAVTILDWGLPEQSGLEVLTWSRAHSVNCPVLMLTARDAPSAHVHALDLGADDYLSKPFDYNELLARLRALLRRTGAERDPLLRHGTLLLDPATHEVTISGEHVDLTPREYRLLDLLLRRAPTVVTRRAIALQVWPDEAEAVGTNTIEVHVARLRGKIARADAKVETVRGAGYRVVAR